MGKCITLLKAENKKYEYLMDYVPLEPGKDVILGLTVRGTEAQFYYGYRGNLKAGERIKCKTDNISCDKRFVGGKVNISFLSDEACREGWFTGAMVGICCQDLTGFGKYGDFDWFEVKTKQA